MTAFAQIGPDGRNGLWVLIENGDVVETVEFPSGAGGFEGFADHIAKYIQILGMTPDRCFVKCWAAGRVLHEVFLKRHGTALGAIRVSDRMRRADMKVIGLDDAG
ncbi:MAG: hypothetical protein ABIW76_17190 [Fibrobacteria bacterium]